MLTWVLGPPPCTILGTSRGLNRAEGEDPWLVILHREPKQSCCCSNNKNKQLRGTGKKPSALARRVASRGLVGGNSGLQRNQKRPGQQSAEMWECRGDRGPQSISCLLGSRSYLKGTEHFWASATRKSLEPSFADFGTQTEPPGWEAGKIPLT